MSRNQLGRRNLTPDQASFLRGKRYNREKATIPNPQGKNQHGEVGGQNVLQPTAAEKLAGEYKVTSRTIKRDGQYAAAIDALATNVGEEIKQKILTRDTTITKKEVISLAKMEPEQQREQAFDLWLSCYTQEEIAATIGAERRTIADWLTFGENGNVAVSAETAENPETDDTFKLTKSQLADAEHAVSR
jgi:hypothetical protein